MLKKRNMLIRWALTLFFIASVIGLVTYLLLPANRKQTQAASAKIQTSTRTPNIGINFGTSGGTDSAFADAMKTSRAHWATIQDLDDAGAPVDANGWPTRDASIMVWEGTANNNGTYQLIFNGQANVATSFNYGVVSQQHYHVTTNTTTAKIVVKDTGAENFSLIFTQTRRNANSAINSGVTNVRLMRPIAVGSTTSYAASTIFTPYIARAIENYSYIRFMSGTNWNTSVTWADRTRVTDSSQKKTLPGESGFEANNIAYEYMVALCNMTGTDLYINIPAHANNDYLTKLAELIKYGSDGVNPYTRVQSHPLFAPLSSKLHVYIEYSNETWNWSFQQAHDIYAMANAEVKSGHSPLNWDGTTSTYLIAFRYPAERTVQISMIFRQIFGDSQMITRIRPILEWQYSNMNDTASIALDFLNSYYNNGDGVKHVSAPHPPAYYLWGAGGAVYFDSGNDNAPTANAIFASGFPRFGGANDYQQTLNIEGQWAHAYGLHYIAYEGGWSVGGDGGDTGVRHQAKLDPRAKQIMLTSFNDFAKAGGDLYTAGTYGQWDDLTKASSYPLVQAAAAISSGSFIPSSPQIGTSVRSQGTTTIRAKNYDISDGSNTGASTNVGATAGYLLRISKTGRYQIAINASGSTEQGKINVFLDGRLLMTLTLSSTSKTFVVSTTALPSGLHGLLIRGIAPTHGNAGSINNITIHAQ